ncbi:hypothetical protein AB3X96_23560 [Paraburkholderia sp. BR13439]|uniref:hypothetical protein n=1 Tax=Paraburkholderia TaxID=1822464 RepID=UPI0034CF2F51
MTDIDATLHAYDYFHDWHVESIVLQNESDLTCPDTLILGLKLGARRVTATFQGVTRLGLENGGTVNIVLSMERARPDTQVEALARNLLKCSLPGKRTAQHIVYLHPTAGFAIAIEFDSFIIREHA